MSSSFVKDCSDASSSSSANTSKTVIIIVNNETGNVALDGNELQNLLASHGADTSQVSVVQMGGGGNVVPTESTPLFASNFGGVAGITGCPSELPLNFMVDGYSAIPIEGSTVGAYAELPLDADALKRLESVLETEEAKEILGDPLLDIVTDPNQLADQFDKLITPNAENRKEFFLGRKKRGAPKRRSQRQLDRAEREEVEKILAENQLMLRKEREELLREKEEQLKEEENNESDIIHNEGVSGSEDGKESKQDVPVKNIKGKGKKIVTATTGLGKTPGNAPTPGAGKNQGNPSTPALGKNQGNPSTPALGKNQGNPSTPALGKNQGNTEATGLGKNQVNPSPTSGPGKNQGSLPAPAKSAEVPARARGKVIKGSKKLIPTKTEEKKNGKCPKKKMSPLIEGRNSKTLTKALQIKELSVKVKKLNESLLPKLPPAGEEGCSSALNEAAILEETSKAGDLTTNGEAALPGDHSKDGEIGLSTQLSLSHEMPTHDSKCKTIIKKGSKSACKTSIQSGLSDSSLPKVLNAVTHSALNQLNFNSTQESELELNNSDIPDTLRPCGDTNTLSEEKSDINFDSKSTCQILIPTQNFSDKEETLNSQKDLSQVKSTCKQTAPPKDFNQSAKQTLNQSVGKKSKLKKVTKVLIPKEKSEVFILNSVIIKSQKENLFETFEHADDAIPRKNSTRQSPIKIVPKVSRNQTPGKFITGKNKKLISWKESERENASPKVIHPQSPSISKSLMNYKIPLKTSSNKRPFLNHQMQNKPTLPSISQPSLQTHRIPTPLVFKQTSTHTSESSHTTSLALSNKSTPPTNSLSSVGPSPKPLPFIDKGAPKPGSVLKNVNAKGNLSNPPISNSNQQSQINFTFNPQKNNSVTKTYPHLSKTKTVAENLVTHVKSVESVNDPKLVNKAIDEVPIHGKLLEGFNKKSPSKILPKEKSKKGIRMSVGGNQIRRSGRPVKKKSFGDDILFFDEKSPIASEEEKENSDSDEFSSIEKNHDGDTPAEEDDDISEELDDDPERLWCTCQKPHNNRFMICCDRCEDWFHGSCVGITKPMGKQMEEDEREWICPNCKKAERAIKGLSTPTKKENEKPNKVKIKSPEVKITQVFELKKSDKAEKLGKKSPKKTKVKEKTEPRVLVYEKASGIVLSGTAAPTLNVLAEWLKANPAYTTLQPAMINSIKSDPRTGTKWINLEEFGLKPEKPSKLDRSLTFQQRIDSGGSHAGGAKEKKSRVTKFLSHSEVTQIEVNRKNEGAIPKQLKSGKLEMDSLPKKKKNSNVLPQEKSSIEKEANKRLSLDKNDIPKKNPELSKSNSVEENSPNSSGVKKVVPKDFIKDPSLKKVAPLKSPEAVDKVVQKSDVMNVRNSVRKMLFDALFKRKSEVKNEFTDMTPNDIKNLCQEIEEHLFSCFNKDVGFKYKSRYRSLMFNIRDTKNSGLYRKILNRTIPPERLAFMTSEELASRELAEWREREEKKELEAIKKNELERLALGNQYIMKSHKGEIVIDKEEFPSKSKDTESVISMAPDTNKSLPDPETQDDPDMISHKNHIYDPSCKICSANTESQDGKKSESIKSSSQDGDREKRKSGRRESESSSSHPSKHKKKERQRHHSHKSRNRDGSHDRETERDRSREGHKGRDRERDRSKERNRQKEKSSRSSKEMERRSSKDSHRHERKSSRDEKRKEEKKRRHSDPQRGDRKRRESETSFQTKEVTTVETKPDSKLEPYEILEPTTTLPENDTLGLVEPPADQNDDEASQIPATPPLSLDILPTPPSWSNPISPIPPWERRFPSPEMVPDSPTYSPDRSPTTPPLPVDIEDDDLLSPATPPLPEDEDRLTPPPMSTLSQKQIEKPVQMPIWKGIISMPDVAKFSAAAFEVSGKALFFTGDVPSVIEVVGRINPDIVWNYIVQMKKSGSKEILVVRFQPACEEEKVSYIALYSYLSSKKRYGVIGNCEKSVKDFYVVPLASHQPIPQALLPLDGPGFEESRPHMLIGVIIRIKHRRIYDPRTGLWNTIGDLPPQHTSVESQEIESHVDEIEKSFTPSPAKKKRISTSDDEDQETFTPSPESTANGSTLLPKIDERGNKADRESMLAELNRQIERDRKELSEMQRKVDENMEKKTTDSPKTLSQDEEGAKGTSSPPKSEKEAAESGTFNGTSLDTSKINIPSNLHEILASIKKKEEAIREKEREIKRRLNLQQEEPKLTAPSSSTSSSKDVDLRLILGSGQDQDLRLLTGLRGPGGAQGLPGIPSVTDPRLPLPPQKDQDFRSRDPRIPREAVSVLNDPSNGPTLSKMSDADLLAKAMEMEEGQNVPGGKPYSRGPEHPPHMVGPHPEGTPLIHPPLQEGAIHPHPFGSPLPDPRFRHPGPDPYNMNPSAPAIGPPMPLPHAPSYRPTPLFPAPHPLEERMPLQCPPDDYPPYQRPPGIDERRSRIENPHWDSRGARREWGCSDDAWESRAWDMPPDRYPDDVRSRKRRWKEGTGGGPPRARWANVEEDWRGRRSWRKDGKRSRKDRAWSRVGSHHDEPPPKEIDY